MDERPEFYGTMIRMHEVVCFDCGEAQMLEGKTIKDAAAEARAQHDWSLGRDKRWRCANCRPRRFGERIQ